MLIKMLQNTINIIGKHDIINVKNFENVEQFNDFYKLHEEEINKMSTVKLNRMFHIKNYKIARRKADGKEEKILCFQQVYPESKPQNVMTTDVDELTNDLASTKERLKALELDNTKIKQQLLEIIKVINGA